MKVVEDFLRLTMNVVRNPGDGCWEWTGATSAAGYGVMTIDTKTVYAHRVVDEFVDGPIPSGVVIRHKCDNPKCCRPSHLERGTMNDNRNDMVIRDRVAHGSRHWISKMNESLVSEARLRHGNGESGCSLAKVFGIQASTMTSLLRGETWKRVS